MMTPREGNTFASRNGLSNRFSHMDQPRFLRHRYEPGSKAINGMKARPSLPAGKNRRKRQEVWHERQKKMPLPFQGAVQGDDSPASPAGAEVETGRMETGQHEEEHPVGGESARQDAMPSRIIFG